jgi:hypothetical protein
MYTLAGVTAMVNAKRPMPAQRRVSGINTPKAPNNSKTPEINTTSRGQGILGGTIRISTSVAMKCAIPPTKNHRNTNPSPMRFIRDTTVPSVANARTDSTYPYRCELQSASNTPFGDGGHSSPLYRLGSEQHLRSESIDAAERESAVPREHAAFCSSEIVGILQPICVPLGMSATLTGGGIGNIAWAH